MCIRTRTYLHAHARRHMRIEAGTRTQTRAHVHIFMHTHADTRTQTHTHADTHTHTHTHTHTRIGQEIEALSLKLMPPALLPSTAEGPSSQLFAANGTAIGYRHDFRVSRESPACCSWYLGFGTVASPSPHLARCAVCCFVCNENR